MDMQNVNSGPSLYDTSIKKREMIDEVMFISCSGITFACSLIFATLFERMFSKID